MAGGPGRKLPELKPLENTSPVLYIGRIPHGFYEKEMEGAYSSGFLFLFIFFSYDKIVIELEGNCVYEFVFCSLFCTIWNHQEIEDSQK